MDKKEKTHLEIIMKKFKTQLMKYMKQYVYNVENYVENQKGKNMAYTPRLDANGIVNNFHWYSDNPFYIAGYGMPNCTCYAWGRFWEIGDPNSTGENKPTQLPTGDGGVWWERAVASGYYETGQTPQLRSCYMFL